MFTIHLPIAKKPFTVKPFLFNNVIDIARLSYENDDESMFKYLIEHFEIKSLCIVDKFFVLLKARQLWLSEKVRIRDNDGYIDLNMSNLFKCFDGINRVEKTVTDGLLSITFTLPSTLIRNSNDDTFIETIKTIDIQNNVICFDTLPKSDQLSVVSKLPPSTFKLVREFYKSIQWEYVLFESPKRNIRISIDFLTSEPYELIKNLYSIYDLHYCREILLYLSKRISSDILYKSTMSDIEYYVDEIYSTGSHSTQAI
jgi:hypothetical protein